MVYLTILALAAVVFLSRYLFLEPRLPVRLNHNSQRFLSYASPAVLTAILAPIVFMPNGEVLLSATSPYILASACCVLLAWWRKNVLLTTLVGMTFFLLLKVFGA